MLAIYGDKTLFSNELFVCFCNRSIGFCFCSLKFALHINLSNVLCITKATIGYFPTIYFFFTFMIGMLFMNFGLQAEATCLLKTMSSANISNCMRVFEHFLVPLHSCQVLCNFSH